MDYCICCGVDLSVLDQDPDGRENPDCARCRAEEAHDFDAQPKVRFDRRGLEITRQHKPLAAEKE